jgi:hypothetical protein
VSLNHLIAGSRHPSVDSRPVRCDEDPGGATARPGYRCSGDSPTTTIGVTIVRFDSPTGDGPWTGGHMRTSVARWVGAVPLLLLMTSTLALVGGVPASPTASALSETHAPNIPIPVPQGAHAATAGLQMTSRNWSGYAIAGAKGTYTSVTGSWTVPTVIAPSRVRARQYSATWVGIDGFSDGDLIQAGTEQDWAGGVPSYDAWWEILPAPETPIKSMTVNPGDVMNVSITEGIPDWTIVVTDSTTGQSFSTQQVYKGALSSAEWIQEAPSLRRRVAPLADYGTVDFSQATANGLNPGLTTSDSIVMAKRGGRIVLSTPSAPNPEQNGFAVAFGSEPPLSPTS